MKELIGKTIKKVFLDTKNDLLKFVVEDELNSVIELTYQVQGDCCSESWFSEIIGISNLINYKKERTLKVLDVKELNLGSTEQRTKQEYDGVYGFLIELENKSNLLIMYRNSSNGYYGGWCSLVPSLNRYEDLNFVEVNDDYYEGVQNVNRN